MSGVSSVCPAGGSGRVSLSSSSSASWQSACNPGVFGNTPLVALACTAWAVLRDADGGAEDGRGLDGSMDEDRVLTVAGERARDGDRVGLLAHVNPWVIVETKFLTSFGTERPFTSWVAVPSVT